MPVCGDSWMDGRWFGDVFERTTKSKFFYNEKIFYRYTFYIKYDKSN